MRVLRRKQAKLPMTVIEIRLSETAGKYYEAPGVQPVFLNQEQAIDYAQSRPCFRSGENRILDSSGKVERTTVHGSKSKVVMEAREYLR